MLKEGNHPKSDKTVRNELSPLLQPGYIIKKTAIMAALDIRLARMHRSPERCARNLMELGQASYPDKLSEKERLDIFQKLVSCCKSKNFHEARNIFIKNFLS
ncbi:MAG: hypothetical protein K0S76_3239 [Herbinix sp.]|nr:hypothetical protein [Herbinix sp.]